MKILFVCSRNEWRSRTAEAIFKNNGLHEIRSAGTANTARIRVNQKMINWADLILVMETKHKKIIRSKFDLNFSDVELEVLDIPDDYEYMDEELVEILEVKLSDLFGNK
ncbi:MAG: low molecular weight protein tyrosine phosphatase family protein [Saprospiraceae bacterium]